MSYDDWRYGVNPDGTVFRGRLYRLGDMGVADSWEAYWDGDAMTAFYDEGFRGLRTMHGTDSDDEMRAIQAHLMEKAGEKGAEGGLDRLAQRLTENPEARFVLVHLTRGTDLYALSWDGDPDRTWRDEIEAVWNGEVYRIECQEYVGHLPTDVGRAGDAPWTHADEICEEFYGEDQAGAGLIREFPLAEFPAERFISEPVGA